jgi:hypothetical protein
MRRGDKPEFLVLEDRIVGINLSSGHCAEHEWGFDSTKKILGVNPKAGFGIDSRRIRSTPERLRWYKLPDGSEGFGLMDDYEWGKVDRVAPELPSRHVGPRFKSGPRKGELKMGRGAIFESYGVAAAWDERSFLTRTTGEDVTKLREVWDAIVAGDAAIWMAGGGPFGGHGLYIMIVSRIPKEFLELQEQSDMDEYEVQEYHRSTGIEKLLKDAGKGWFSLHPQRFPNGFTTRRGVVADTTTGGYAWWLNPSDQKNNEFGWYTLEELQAWARNEGPIPKQAS